MSDSESVLKFTHTCIKGREFESLKYKEYQEPENLTAIKKSLSEFHAFFFNLDQGKFKFSDYFGIEPNVTKYAKDNYELLLEKYVEDSIDKNMLNEGINPDEENSAVETPFFMPLKSIILELSKKIVTELQ
jgi:hypothetical protein